MITDSAKKEAGIKFRQGILGKVEYARKYTGLEHLYYSKDWFEEQLSHLDVNYTIKDQNIPGYQNNEYRYNIIIEKC